MATLGLQEEEEEEKEERKSIIINDSFMSSQFVSNWISAIIGTSFFKKINLTLSLSKKVIAFVIMSDRLMRITFFISISLQTSF